MKKVYLIQYRISENIAFENNVKSIGTWIKYFDDNWLVESTLSSKEIYEKLTVGNNDKSIFIIEVSTTNYYGRMNTKVWDYLKLSRKK